MIDQHNAADGINASMGARSPFSDGLKAVGRFTAVCRDANGDELWRDGFDNLITTVGKNFLLDQALAGSSYTAIDYMGLISSVGFTAVAASDTMTSHSGWVEAGGANAPTMSSTRQTCSWSAAASGTKALSTGTVFTFSGTGTVQGAFIVLGSGASATIGNTGGTLYSAGTLTASQPVISGNTLTVSYSTTLT